MLVHAVLATVPLQADEAVVTRIARAEGRMLGSTEQEVVWAARAATTALAHPLLRAAAGAEHRRESSISLREADGTITIGLLDLAYREADGWVIVDFKTDAELEARRAVYEEQVRAYARAVRAATGAPVRGVLLSV